MDTHDPDSPQSRNQPPDADQGLPGEDLEIDEVDPPPIEEEGSEAEQIDIWPPLSDLVKIMRKILPSRR
jgi:hypothetical protein